eukprot:1864737-Rhodomonas_salina.1
MDIIETDKLAATTEPDAANNGCCSFARVLLDGIITLHCCFVSMNGCVGNVDSASLLESRANIPPPAIEGGSKETQENEDNAV